MVLLVIVTVLTQPLKETKMAESTVSVDHKHEAIRWLNVARGVGNAVGCIEEMHKHLKLGNHTLSDIQTSEEGLKVVVRDYHKREAQKWLNGARGAGKAVGCIAYMREHLALGKHTLKDIGTDEAELERLLKKVA